LGLLDKEGGLLVQWKNWICQESLRRHENIFRLDLQNAFQQDNLLLSGSDDYYSQLDLAMISDHLFESWRPREPLNIYTEDDITEKIALMARWFVGKSVAALNESDADSEKFKLLKADCFHMSSLYLECVSVEHECELTKLGKTIEFERIYCQMREFLGELVEE
jgi:hypothetical protein